MKQFTIVFLALIFSASLPAQTGSITNTLGTGGSFTIKDGSTTFLTLNQSDGALSVTRNLFLPNTGASGLGIIYKGADRFMHDFQPPGTSGYNTFVGASSGSFTMTGSGNDASYNTGVGFGALASLTTGTVNSAFGVQALQMNTSGGYNSAYGMHALRSNTTGGNNSAFGPLALYNNTTGNYNSAFGYNAGSSLTSGTNTTIIGSNAQPSSATAANEITLGNNAVQYLRCNTSMISTLSDARDKKEISSLPLGVDFLMTIKPRIFYWDRREWYDDGKADGSKMKQEPTAGFIAQELDEAQTNAHAEWLNLVLKSNPDRLEATPGNLLPVMIKAIQELAAQNKALAERIARLEQQNASAKNTVAIEQ